MTNPQTEARAIARKYTTIPAEDRINLSREIATALAAKDAELADLREQNERQEATIVRFNSRAERAEAQLAERAGGVKVKALEWTKDDSVGGHGGWIGRAGDFIRAVKIGWMVEMPYEFGDQAFATLDDAKSAAQADHERCILSALEPASPEPKTLVHEPMVWTGEGPYGFSPAAPEEQQEAVAWLREDTLTHVNGRRVLRLCSQYDRGAFPVYTRPVELAVTVERAAEAIDVEWRKKGGLNCTHVCAVVRALPTGGER